MNKTVRSHHSTTLLEQARSPLGRFCDRLIFALLILVFVGAPLMASRSRPSVETALMLLVVLAGGCWVVRILISHEAQIVFSPLGAPLVAFATYALVRYSLALVEPVARPDMLLVVSATLFFFLVLNHFRHRWQITFLVWTLTTVGVALSILACWQFLRGERSTATFARPEDLAVYLLLVMPVVVSNFFFSRRALPERIGFAFAGLLMCAAFAMTRAYWHWLGALAACLVIAFFVIQKRSWRFRWLVMASCLALAVVAGAFLAYHQLRYSGGESGESVPATPEVVRPATPPLPPTWKTVLGIGQRNLWLGAGPGMIEWLYPTQRSVQARVRRCGNEYLNIFAESGLIGCVLTAWVLITFIVCAAQILGLRARRYSATQQSNRFAFAIAGLAAVAAAMVNAAVDLNLRVAGNTFTMLGMMSAVLTCGVHRRINEEQPAAQPGRHITLRVRGVSRWVLAAGVAVLLLLMAPLRRSLPAAWFLQSGRRAARQLDWPAAERAYKLAWRFDNRDFEAAIALGELYITRATWNSRQRETLAAQALSWYRRARTLNPYAYDVLIRIARTHDLLGQRAEALAAYKEAVQNDSRNASYYAQLGWHYERWEDHESAQKSFRTARQLGALEVLPENGT